MRRAASPPATPSRAVRLSRRRLLCGAGALGAALALPRTALGADQEIQALIALFGTVPPESPRLRLEMPDHFPNGYTVPLDLEIDCAMTEADYPRSVEVVAPYNPYLQVVRFRFTPSSGQARISTRIRLAQPQNVLAVASMSDGSMIMARRWVAVDSNGCA